MPGRTVARWSCAAIVVVALYASTGTRATAQAGVALPLQAMAIGEIAAPAAPAMAPVLARSLDRVVRELSGTRRRAGTRPRYVLRGALTKLERGPEHVRCEVQLIVADRGSVRMMLRGQAEARGGSSSHRAETALQAAVRSALRPLAPPATARR